MQLQIKFPITASKSLFVAMFLGYNQYWPDEFMVFVALSPGAPEGSTGSGSGFKASQKTGAIA